MASWCFSEAVFVSLARHRAAWFYLVTPFCTILRLLADAMVQFEYLSHLTVCVYA